ncbi:hypothetical protein NUW54_g13591 [Trametes sanguinea]|uniref:Uncharacterized protein n=1 Tax=Trametes sanguinea TaxID=158606 RepID=A0ACC1MLQ7_9APHY|nr:hypothetical protein NUW54_g13591 [Trametes sanguinea]
MTPIQSRMFTWSKPSKLLGANLNSTLRDAVADATNVTRSNQPQASATISSLYSQFAVTDHIWGDPVDKRTSTSNEDLGFAFRLRIMI